MRRWIERAIACLEAARAGGDSIGFETMIVLRNYVETKAHLRH